MSAPRGHASRAAGGSAGAGNAGGGSAAGGSAGALAGTGELARLIVRRDRLRLAAWALLAVGVPLLNVVTFRALAPTAQAQRDFVAGSAANPVITAMLGRVQDVSLEGIVAWRSGVQCLLIAGLAGALLLVRHTRAEEESGHRELVGATPVGRAAGLMAALAVVGGMHLLIAMVLGAALVAWAGFPVAGSFAFALVVAAGGWVYAGIAALAGQVARGAARARGLAVGAVAVSFAPAVLGDQGNLWWAPIGWARLLRPYAGERWVVLLVPLACALVTVTAAHLMAARRDVGAGVLPERVRDQRGPVAAAAWLRGPVGLAWRLQRQDLVGTGWGLVAFAGMLGWGAASFDGLFGDLAAMRDWLSALGVSSLGEAFLAVVTFDLRLIVACVAIGTALRLRGDEVRGLAEPVLAGPTGRVRWLACHAALAFAGPSVILLVASACAGLVYGIASGRSDAVVAQVGAAVAFLPAAWFMAAFAIALFGLWPRAAAAGSWGLMTGLVVVVLLWETRAIDVSLFRLTPFGYSHPGVASGAAAPLLVTLFAALLLAVGVAGFRRRDIGV